jgi:hypothetical protein
LRAACVSPYRMSARGAIFGREPALASSGTSTGNAISDSYCGGKDRPIRAMTLFFLFRPLDFSWVWLGLSWAELGKSVRICYLFSLKGAAA